MSKYIIETELGRFEGETEREAKKLLRAAKKEADAQRTIATSRRHMASLHAAVQAATIMDFFIEGAAPCGWRFYPAGHENAARVVYDDEGEYRADLIVDTKWGRTNIELYRPELVGSLMDGSGYTIAVWLQDGQQVAGHAVGHSEGESSMYRLPLTIQPDFFKAGR